MTNHEKKDHPVKEKLKEGVSVHEIEKYANKYMFEIFMIAALIIAMISSIFDFFIGSNWGIFLLTIGILIGFCLTNQVDPLLSRALKFMHNKEKSTLIMIGIVRIIVAIFLPAILWGVIGVFSGSSWRARMKHDV